ncbi:SDR family oxidoreductase [bacterium]|nr:SDR family oxidoreductase [bacterium]
MSWLNLEDKIAIITGAASGIGREVAIALAENGCSVVVADIMEKSEDIIKQPQLSRENEKYLYIQTDITKIASVERMVKKTIEAYNKIDILVNNAGINIPRLLVSPNDPKGKYELHEDEFDRMISINQKGVYLCTQAVVREMIKKQVEGAIINITSECGLEGSEGQSCYAATKAALYAFTRSWGKELGRYGIRVIGVAPGILEKTALRNPEYEKALAYTRGITIKQLREGYKKVSVPLEKVGKLREVSDLVCFLASKRASYITGTTYNISGGKTRA